MMHTSFMILYIFKMNKMNGLKLIYVSELNFYESSYQSVISLCEKYNCTHQYDNINKNTVMFKYI